MNSPRYVACQFILKRPTADTHGLPRSGDSRLRLNHGAFDAFYRLGLLDLGSLRLGADSDAAGKGQALAIRRGGAERAEASPCADTIHDLLPAALFDEVLKTGTIPDSERESLRLTFQQLLEHHQEVSSPERGLDAGSELRR